MKCRWCNEGLVYSDQKGWLHESDMAMYTQKMIYPEACRNCGGRLRNGYCSRCEIQHNRELGDDHCAVPVPD